MSADKLVAIVGHSLVPRDIGVVQGAQVRIFRSPGARASYFGTNHILSSVLSWPHDLTILFIGGNDIHDECVPSAITDNICSVIEQIHQHCNSRIACVLVEHRNPPQGNRFNVSADQYKRIANSINNRLKRKYKSKNYICFLSIGAKPYQNGVTDGVHHNQESKRHLIQKFRNTIKRFVDNRLL